MKKWTIAIAQVVAGTLSIAVAVPQTTAPGVMALTPSEMKWSSQGGLALPGMEQINLVGDPPSLAPIRCD